MIKSLYRRLTGVGKGRRATEALPKTITIGELPPFPLAKHIKFNKGFPIPDWDAVIAWVAKIKSPKQQEEAWNACERGWLLYFRQALGSGYFFSETDEVRLISALPVLDAQSAMGFVEHVVERIVVLLEGLAEKPPDKEILILFDDDKTYHRYVGLYYPDDTKTPPSSGCCIRNGCLHFVARAGNLAAIEKLLVHELTGLCLTHLRIPVWIVRGLFAYTEQQLGHRTQPEVESHLFDEQIKRWDENTIQRFWSGKAFRRGEDDQALAEDLAFRLVAQMAENWHRFSNFAHNAAPEDGGALAASDFLGVDLGTCLTTMLFRKPKAGWSPDPASWSRKAPSTPAAMPDT